MRALRVLTAATIRYGRGWRLFRVREIDARMECRLANLAARVQVRRWHRVHHYRMTLPPWLVTPELGTSTRSDRIAPGAHLMLLFRGPHPSEPGRTTGWGWAIHTARAFPAVYPRAKKP